MFEEKTLKESRMQKLAAASEKLALEVVAKTTYTPGYALGHASHVRPLGFVTKLAVRGANSFLEGVANGVNAHHDKVEKKVAELKAHAEKVASVADASVPAV